MNLLGQAESELRIAATAFDSQQCMMITDAQGVILRVNQAFTKTTGYSAAEAVGQTPRLLRSGRHPPEFYAEMWQTLLGTGSWEGEIWDRRKNGEIYADWLSINAVRDAAGRVTHYVAAHTDLTRHKEAEAKIARLAFYDPLTQLPNRQLLLDRLQHALSVSQLGQRYGALLFVDVDDFKTVNNVLGYELGDQLLRQIADRLKASLCESYTIARLGGDEFVAVLEDLGGACDEAAIQAKAGGRKILELLAEPFQLGEQEHQGGVSIGVTLFPGSAQGVDELLKQAELAMYEAKAAGRNCMRFFDAEMQRVATQRAELVAALREALAGRQFVLHYQPQVDGEGSIVGAEVLLRWDRPGHGMVSPAAFIPVAEDSGLILPIGDWVLETACQRLLAWAEEPAFAQLTLSVNVSAQQFSRSDFVDQLAAILKRTGANPHRLKLELTESLLIDDVEAVIGKMGALQSIGVSFALDDFGTGYSSLAYLQRLPLDQLKIDQSFVRNLQTEHSSVVIAQTIIALGRSMGMSVTAEGIETEEQRRILADLGCNLYQGYFLGRPMPLDDFHAFVERSAHGD